MKCQIGTARPLFDRVKCGRHPGVRTFRARTRPQITMQTASPEAPHAEAFQQLRAMLGRHADALEQTSDAPQRYALAGAARADGAKGTAFGEVVTQERYVAYHLFAVYLYPELLDGLPEALRARMQGKSCFNFKRALTAEQLDGLAQLTGSALDRYRAEGLVDERSA